MSKKTPRACQSAAAQAPKRLILLLAALLIALPLRAQEKAQTIDDPELIPSPVIPKEMEIPPPPEQWYLRWMIHPRRKGMVVTLPVIDTDPNRGTTIGILPIWIIEEAGSDRIEQMHAPSLTYNRSFKLIPTYRYYWYPDTRSALIARASVSQLGEQEILGQYDSAQFLGRDLDFSARFQYNIDGSNRFYGLGPNSSRSQQSIFSEDVIHSNFSIGMPVAPKSPWRVHARNHYVMGEDIDSGLGKSNLPDITNTYPDLLSAHWQTTNETLGVVDYDTRDDPNTTSRGAFLQAYFGGSIKGFASQFDYGRAGLDAREFLKWKDSPNMTTALHFKYEQLVGDVPFWLLPKLGGKYSIRAYGDGRYMDNGAMFVEAEQRYVFYRDKMAGTTVDLEVAPFVGLGSVFAEPKRLAARYMRPVLGFAVRAVARPQVVGSMDFGYGQEGLTAFIDINYSF